MYTARRTSSRGEALGIVISTFIIISTFQSKISFISISAVSVSYFSSKRDKISLGMSRLPTRKSNPSPADSTTPFFAAKCNVLSVKSKQGRATAVPLPSAVFFPRQRLYCPDFIGSKIPYFVRECVSELFFKYFYSCTLRNKIGNIADRSGITFHSL